MRESLYDECGVVKCQSRVRT